MIMKTLKVKRTRRDVAI